MSLRDALRTDLGALVRGTPADDGGRHRRSHVWPGPIYLRLQRWRRDLLIVTEQIAALVHANAPMVRGLDAAAMDAPNGNVEAILLTVRDDIAAGESLADAMALRPRFFPSYFVDLVRAGERTGRLGECLRESSDSVRWMVDHRAHKSQFAYPALLLLIHVLLGTFMLVKVYPVFAEISSEMDGGASMPDWIPLVVGYIETRYPSLLGLAVLAFLAIVVVPRVAGSWVQSVMLYMPIWRRVERKKHLSHVTHVLKTMLRADVPLDRALAECAVLAVPRPYRLALANVTDRVEAGETLADSLEYHPRLFHRAYRDLIRLGERSGRLPEVLDRLTTLYDAQTAKILRIAVDYTLALCVVCVSVITLASTLLIFQLNITLVRSILEQM